MMKRTIKTVIKIQLASIIQGTHPGLNTESTHNKRGRGGALKWNELAMISTPAKAFPPPTPFDSIN